MALDSSDRTNGDGAFITSGAPDLNTAYTVMCWAYIDTTGNNEYHTIIALSDGTSGSNYDGAYFFRSGGTRNYLLAMDNGSYTEGTGGSRNDGTWTHIALVRASTTDLQLYVDGSSTITNAGTQSAAPGSPRLNLCHHPGYLGDTLDGGVAFLKAWSTNLTAAEIAEEMDAAWPVTNRSSVTHWVPFTTNTDLSDRGIAQNGDWSLVAGTGTRANPPGLSPLTAPGVRSPIFGVPSGAGGGQTIDAAFIASGSTTYAATVTGARTISAAYIASGSTPYDATVSSNFTISAAAIASGSQVFAATVTGARTISAAFISSGSQLFLGDVSSGQTIDAAYIASGSQLFAATVTGSRMINAAFIGGGGTLTNPQSASMGTAGPLDNLSPDGFTWAQAHPAQVDQYGNLIALAQDNSGNKDVDFVYSNDAGSTWSSTALGEGFLQRGALAIDDASATAHVLWEAQSTTDGIIYRRYDISYDGSNNITGFTKDTAINLQLDNGAATLYGHPSLLYLSDIGSNGALLAMWTVVDSDGGELRASMRTLSLDSNDNTASNWAAPVTDDASTISTDANVPYSIIESEGSGTAARTARASIARKAANTNANDVYVWMAKDNGSGDWHYAFRRMRWNSGSSDWSTGLTTVTNVTNITRAGTNSGYTGKHETISQMVEDGTNDRVYVAFSTWKDNTDGDTWSFIYIDCTSDTASSIVDVYNNQANAASDNFIVGDISFDDDLAILIVSYTDLPNHDAYVVRYDGTTEEQSALQVSSSIIWDIPTLTDGRYDNAGTDQLLITGRDFNSTTPASWAPPYQGYFATVDFAGGGNQVFVPTVSSNYTIAAAYISSGSQLFAATITGARTISAAYISSGSQIFLGDVSSGQTIDAAYIASGSQLFAATITGARTISAATIASGSTPYDATVTSNYTISAATIASGSQLFAATVTGARTISAATIASGSTPYDATVTSNYTISAATIASGSTPYDATVTSNYTISAATIASGSQLFAATVTGARTISAAFISSGSQLFLGTVSADNAQTIDAAFISSGSQLFTATVTGARTISAATIASGSTPYDATVTSNYTISAATIASGSQVFAATITGSRTISAAFISSGSQTFLGTVTADAGAQTISAAFISSGSQLFAATITGARTISAATIASGSAPYDATVTSNYTIAAAAIVSGSQAFTAAVTGARTISAAFISSGSQTYPAAIGRQILAAYISSASTPYDATVTSNYTITAATIASGSQLFAAAISGTRTITAATIASASQVFAGTVVGGTVIGTVTITETAAGGITATEEGAGGVTITEVP